MRKFITGIAVAVCMAALSYSCTDSFLDRKPYNYSPDGFYSSEEAIKLGVSPIYNYVLFDRHNLDYGCPGYIYLDTFTGLCAVRDQNTSIGAGFITPELGAVLNYWKNWYGLIARANELLDGAAPYVDDLKNTAASQYLAEARILRAFAYYMLISAYGDVPFFTEPVTVDKYKESRTDRVVIMDFILDEIDEVQESVPWTAAERGRVDRAFAYGLKARAALLAGSLDYGGRGEEYFRIAEQSASKVIGQRQLALSYEDLFTKGGQEKADVRSEFLLETWHNTILSSPRTHVIPQGNASRMYGQTNRHPTSLIADIFEDTDGRRIDQSSTYNPQKPMENRDPRMRATLWGHGDLITGNTTGDVNNLVKFYVDAYEDQVLKYNYNTQAWEYTTNLDVTGSVAYTSFSVNGCGYLLKKFAADTTEAVDKSTLHMPIMRYAEVLLTYAEAKIELNELDGSVYEAINLVRNRAGMPNVSSDRIGDQNKMRQLVRRERKVEFFMEGLHWVDMRRWGIGDLENEKPSYGTPNKETRFEGMAPGDVPSFNASERHDLNDIPNYHYKEKLLTRDPNREWKAAYNLWPIPQTERDLNENLTQNDGY